MEDDRDTKTYQQAMEENRANLESISFKNMKQALDSHR